MLMQTKRVPMTQQGSEKLRAELDKLKQLDRPKIIQAIADARAHGDLKENAEYHAAREQQGLIEARIQDIENKLTYAHIIDIRKIPPTGKVIFGTTVELINLDTEESLSYQIVGEDEADLALNKISITSPIAQGLIGRHEGDEVKISTPEGIRRFEINSVVHT